MGKSSLVAGGVRSGGCLGGFVLNEECVEAADPKCENRNRVKELWNRSRGLGPWGRMDRRSTIGSEDISCPCGRTLLGLWKLCGKQGQHAFNQCLRPPSFIPQVFLEAQWRS